MEGAETILRIRVCIAAGVRFDHSSIDTMRSIAPCERASNDLDYDAKDLAFHGQETVRRRSEAKKTTRIDVQMAE